MKVCNVLNCSFPLWYQRFSKVTVESVIIDLPKEFTEYLKADGVVLPDCLTPRPNYRVTSNDSDTSDSEVDWGSADEDSISAPSFPELDTKIKKAINDLGGRIYPKLNWSSPKDATWIAMNKSLCCYAVRDIYLLLKSSDFISHDLTQPFKDCTDIDCTDATTLNVDYKLVLRKWIEIDPGCEFRCFVKNNELVGISQRDHTSFYSYIEKTQKDIIRDILSFYKEHLKSKFYDCDFTFDVYRKCKDEVNLVDFNPFGKTTDSLLFDWNEFNSMEYATSHPEIRFVNINCGVQPSPMRHYGLPRDMVDLTTGEDPYKLIDLLSLRNGGLRRNEVADISSDDENED